MRKNTPSDPAVQPIPPSQGFFAVIDEHYQIGEVAEDVGLSLRTIRYYEEIGLVEPSGRTEGGFRLYTDADVERLRLVRALKPVGMSLETMAELLDAADFVAGSRRSRSAETRLVNAVGAALQRCEELEHRLREARRALEELSAVSTGGKR